MKARVKATGDIVDATLIQGDNGKLWYEIDKSGHWLTYEELDFNFVREPDYWEKLKHQYAGMAMQGMIANLRYYDHPSQGIVEDAIAFAHALVEKMKEERK